MFKGLKNYQNNLKKKPNNNAIFDSDSLISDDNIEKWIVEEALAWIDNYPMLSE